MQSGGQQFGYLKKLSDKYSRLESDIYNEAVKHSDTYLHKDESLDSSDSVDNEQQIKDNIQFIRLCLTYLHEFTWQNAIALIQQELDQFDAYVEASRLQSTVMWLRSSTGIYEPYYLIGIASDFEGNKSRMLFIRLYDDKSNDFVLKCVESDTDQADYIYDLQDFLFSHRVGERLLGSIYSQGVLRAGANVGIKLSTSDASSSILDKIHSRSQLKSLSGAIGSNTKDSKDTSSLVQDSFRVTEVVAPELSAKTWREFRIEVFIARVMIMNGKNEVLTKTLKQQEPTD